MKKLEFLEGKANMEKNPPEFEFLQRKPKEAIKKLILVRSDGCDVGHGMDSSFVASALFFFFLDKLVASALLLRQTSHMARTLLCEVCRVKQS